MKRYHWHSVKISVCIVFLAFLLSTSTHLLSSHPTVKASLHPDNMTGLNEPEDSGNTRIMPLGDSITFGIGSPTYSSYRLILWQDLTAAGIKFSFVGSQRSGAKLLPQPANEGHPGWHIHQISAHIVSWLRTYRPNYVLLHIGTNDILHRDDPVHAPARLKLLLDQITTTLPGVIVLVAQITPLSSQFEAQVETFNKAIPAIVRAEVAAGKHIQYVDIHDSVPLKDLPDQVHPDDTGYALMARAWYLALHPLLSSGRTRAQPVSAKRRAAE